MIQVDPEDEALLAAFRWRVDGRGYVVRSNGWRVPPVRLHREIMRAPVDLEVDHINGDKLDNRRANLRLVTHAQQAQNIRLPSTNRSGHRGVSYCRTSQKWVAQAMCGGRRLYRRYDTLEEAADAARAWRAENMTHAVDR